MSTPKTMLDEDMYSPAQVTPLPSFSSLFEPCDASLSMWDDTTDAHTLQTLKAVPPTAIFEESMPSLDPIHWNTSHPSDWTTTDVYSWIYHVANKYNLNMVSGEKFQGLDGRKLVSMHRSDFQSLDHHYGTVLYDDLQNILVRYSPTSCPSTGSYYADDRFDFEEDLRDILNNKLWTDPVLYRDQWLPPHIPSLSQPEARAPEMIPPHVLEQRSEEPQVQQSNALDLSIAKVKPGPTRKPRRPRKSSDSSVNSSKENQQPSGKTRGRKPGQVSKAGNHLWEFIRDLLHDNHYNPRIIKWEDSDRGVFRIVKSSEVSALWGKKKNNSKMTYEKLSRALRFCRGEKYFADLPKDGTFPKKLVFKFGEKAYGWKLERSAVSQK